MTILQKVFRALAIELILIGIATVLVLFFYYFPLIAFAVFFLGIIFCLIFGSLN